MGKSKAPDRPRPGLIGRVHSLIVPVGLLVLGILCAILWFTSPENGPLALLQPVATALPEVTSLPLPMLRRSDVITDSLYLVQVGTGSNTDIFRLRAVLTPTLVNLTYSSGVSEFWPVPSPDGERLAFYAFNDGVQGSLRVLQVDGSVLDLTYHNLASGLTSDYALDLSQPPVWSPDGTWLAFLARQIASGGHVVELFVARSDGTAVRRLTYTGNRIMSPIWLSNTELACVEIRGNGRAIVYTVSIVQQPPTPEPLTDELAMPK